MSPTLPCRFFSLGHCQKGSQCPYLHTNDQKSQVVCQFYLKGNCTFGTKCQLLHSKPRKSNSTSATSSLPRPSAVSSSTAATAIPFSQVRVGNKMISQLPTLCKFSYEECKFGDRCRAVHGLQCPSCLLYVLHPKQSEKDHQEHIAECIKNRAAEERSAEMECVVCFDTIRKKGKGSFGLLVCQHCVCYTCITTWRENASQKMANSKTCPICRTVTRFIVPSTVWPSSEEEKEEITNAYKFKLSNIDCRAYNFGKGTCSFGTSCFYKHVDEHGVLEAEKTRILSTDDFDETGIKVMKVVQLFDYLNID